jgi:hypothetical protein
MLLGPVTELQAILDNQHLVMVQLVMVVDIVGYLPQVFRNQMPL